MSSRQSLYDRHALHKLNVAGVSRLIDEYNQLMSKLSPSEVGLFRSKILTLDKKIWNGIYKYSWGEQTVSYLFRSKSKTFTFARLKWIPFQVIGPWIKSCNETIFNMTRDVLEYKRINSLIHNIISDMKRLQFLKIDEFEEYEPDVFCTTQYNEVKAQTSTIKTRCNTLARYC